MIRAFQNLSLKVRVAVFTLGLLLLAIGILTWQFSTHLRQELEEKLSRQQFSEVSAVAERIDNAVRLRMDALVLTAQDITPQMLARPERVSAFLAERKALYKLYTLGAIVISADGQGVADYPPAKGRGKADFTQIDFYRQVMATGKPAISRPGFGRYVKEPRVVFAVPIFGKDNKIAGVLAGAVSLSDGSLLQEFDASANPNRNSYLLISPRDNLFVAASDRSRVMQALPAPGSNLMHDRYMSGFEGSGIAINSRGVEELSSAKQIPAAGWFIVGVMPTAQAFERIAHIRNEAMLAAAIVALLSVMLLWLFLRHELSFLTRSSELIGQLSNSKKAVLRGIPLSGSPEIRHLQNSFNQLQQHLAQDEQLLLEDKLLYQSMFTNNTSIKLLIDPRDGRIVDANPAAAEFYGWPAATMRQMRITDINTQPAEKVKREMELAKTEQRQFFRFKHRLASGEIRDVEVHSGHVDYHGRDLLYSIKIGRAHV